MLATRFASGTICLGVIIILSFYLSPPRTRQTPTNSTLCSALGIDQEGNPANWVECESIIIVN